MSARRLSGNIDLKRQATDVVALLRLLSNTNRLLILCHLIEGECSVAELEEQLSIRQPALSQQLAKLRENGLISARRSSRSIIYSLTDCRAYELIQALHDIYCTPRGKTAALPRPQGKARKTDAAAFAKILT